MSLSVIIPAYNAAATLEVAVRSVLGSTYPDLEVFVVDDGSTDATGAVADRLAREEGRVKVIHQANAGAYTARKAAIGCVRSRYVAFADADDAVMPTMYERLIAFAEEHALDMAQCDVVGESPRPSELFLSREEVLHKIVWPRLIRGEGAMCLWNRVYRREAVCFDWDDSPLLMFEDLAVQLQAFRRISRAGYLHEPLYDYRVNDGSSVRNFRPKNIDDFREALRFRARYSSCYGVSPEDPVHRRWKVMNGLNVVKVLLKSPRWSLWGKVKYSLKMLRELA